MNLDRDIEIMKYALTMVDGTIYSDIAKDGTSHVLYRSLKDKDAVQFIVPTPKLIPIYVILTEGSGMKEEEILPYLESLDSDPKAV